MFLGYLLPEFILYYQEAEGRAIQDSQAMVYYGKGDFDNSINAIFMMDALKVP